MHEEILKFWFNECDAEQWFKKDKKFDLLIRNRFWFVFNDSIEKKLDHWVNQPMSCLALILILDQFSRNLFRKSPKAFDQDCKARELCEVAISNEYIECYTLDQRLFALLPLVHSEDIEAHMLAEKMLRISLNKHPRYANIKSAWDDHRKAIELFGRYPHRCEVLGLATTKEEKQFLKGPNSSW